MNLFKGIWGGKGQGKTFQTELIFRALGVEPIIMSAGELESERAGKCRLVFYFTYDLLLGDIMWEFSCIFYRGTREIDT